MKQDKSSAVMFAIFAGVAVVITNTPDEFSPQILRTALGASVLFTLASIIYAMPDSPKEK